VLVTVVILLAGPEKGHLLEARRSSGHSRLACASTDNLPCSSQMIASHCASGMLSKALVAGG
jgi:hypothetical protein